MGSIAAWSKSKHSIAENQLNNTESWNWTYSILYSFKRLPSLASFVWILIRLEARKGGMKRVRESVEFIISIFVATNSLLCAQRYGANNVRDGVCSGYVWGAYLPYIHFVYSFCCCCKGCLFRIQFFRHWSDIRYGIWLTTRIRWCGPPTPSLPLPKLHFQLNS